MDNALTNAIADLQEEEALKIANEKLSRGEDPKAILDDCKSGLEIVGKRFSTGEYFVPDLIYSGEIFRQIADIVKPKLKSTAQSQKIGKVIVGTVAGDIHDIGKDIVVFMLDVNGFEVYDLGIDVPVQKFIDKMKETKAPVIALSGFLTLAFDAMKETIDAMKQAGLRDTVKVMIGGGQIDEEIKKYTGADAWGKDAMTAVTLAKAWLGGN